jgi:3-hydroxyisobutyrate dehydrogenase-like beta-hydroxyacid dehydrogenase
MAKTITDAGGRYVDGGIIGGPPRTGYAPRFYVSGTHRAALLELDGKGIQVMDVGDEIGRASAIKMCYASMTKGINALQTAMMSASARLGVYDELVAELETSQSAALERIEASVQRLPSVAGRWIGEMEEIAATFESVGVTGDFHKGAAAIFRLADSATIESDKTRDMESTIKAFAARIEQ